MPMLDIQRRHAEVFRLRFGERGSKGEPKKLTDRIRVTSPSEAVVSAFTEVFGGEVKAWTGGEGNQFEAYLPTSEIPIMVLPGQSITQWWELYRGSVCERRCDGDTEQLSGKACMCPADITDRLNAAAGSACRPMTRVAVLCPDVAVVGAGSFVSHGMIAAETVPQAIAVAEAALARGLMVPAVLRVVEHRGKRHYVVPQIEIVGVSLRTLASGEVPEAVAAGTTAALAPAPPAALEAPKATAPTTKAPAKKAAAKKAAAAREAPPLPGENESTPSEPADDFDRSAFTNEFKALDPEFRPVATERLAAAGIPAPRDAALTKAHVEAAEKILAEVEGEARETYLRRQKRANAVMGEVGVKTDDARHALVKEATGGETESTGRLTDAQIAAVVDYCDALKRQDQEAAG